MYKSATSINQRNTLVVGHTSSPLGDILVASHDEALAGLWFVGQKYERQPYASDKTWYWETDDTDSFVRRVSQQLDEYFSGRRQHFELPLSPHGTPFQQQVWRALGQIACGQTVSYGELARQLGNPSAVRAVAAAVGRNPVSVIIPCHRVIGADGRLTGYAGGLDRKKKLLALEVSQNAVGDGRLI